MQIQYSRIENSRVTMVSIKLNVVLEKKATGILLRVFAQFRVDYPISFDRVSPRKREFTEGFHVHA